MKTRLIILLFTFLATTAFAPFGNEKVEVGKPAPALVFKDVDGKELDLKTINKKRIVLIDFWASWCGPCRASSPALVKLYNDYKGKKFKGAKKGFTVLSVSLDNSAEPWKKAIADDKYTWPYHMSDLKGWQSAAAAAYGVNFIPQCFLVDASGMVIGKYNRIEQAEADLKKFLK